jgi:hypothetical protein
MGNKINIEYLVGITAGLGVVGLVALIVKEKDRLEDFLPVFRNFFGGNTFLTGYPRGIKNNNPGNIEMTKTLWKGEISFVQNTDGRFKQFYHFTYGIRAAILNLKSYYNDGYRTIRQMISRWAPPKENNTEGYIRFVSGYTGIAENTPVAYNMQTIKKLVEAIIIKENGRLYMGDNDFELAWRLV